MNITVGSWNIWIYGRRDFRGIAGVIRRNKIDVLGIQEAGNYLDDNKIHMAKAIAEELGFHYVFYKTVDLAPAYNCIQGNAVLSRFPIVESRHYSLNPPNVKADPRVLIHSKIRLGNNKVLNFLTTHLQYYKMFKSTSLRMTEVENILKVVNRLKQNVVLTGDFNSLPGNKEIKRMEKVLNRIGGNKPTFSMHPFRDGKWTVESLRYRLDNIFISKELRYEKFEIMKSEISDHLPIKATLKI